MNFFLEIQAAPAAWTILSLTILTSLWGFKNRRFYERLQLHPPSVIHLKEGTRLISAGFIHVDLFHLISNCWIFYVFAVDLEKAIPADPHLTFLSVYLCGIVFGNAGTCLIKRNDFSFTSAGASAGVIAATVAYAMVRPGDHYLVLPLLGAIPNVLVILFYLAILVYFKNRQQKMNIEVYSHWVGAFTGIGWGWII